jgi:bromodomain-containing factor 1
MDLTTVKERIKQGYYESYYQWRQDIEVMFENCARFNEDGSDIHSSGIKLRRFFHNELRQSGLENKNFRIR